MGDFRTARSAHLLAIGSSPLLFGVHAGATSREARAVSGRQMHCAPGLGEHESLHALSGNTSTSSGAPRFTLGSPGDHFFYSTTSRAADGRGYVARSCGDIVE